MSHGDRSEYRPGIDGLRAVAIAAVLLYHGDVSWMRGGFLSVSLFFTISGFLVTRLLLGEHAEHSGIELAAFWARRARRLLPSALLVIAVVLVLAPSFADAGQRAALPGDAIGSVFYFANWRFFAADVSYAASFFGQSPLLHYWSLAIEEQFYIVWPLVVTAVLGQYRPRPNGKSILAALCGLGIVTSAVVAQFAGSLDRVYYGTDTRASELLMGALLALTLTNVRYAATARRVAAWLAPSAVVAFVGLCVFARLSDGWIRHGGLAGFALISAVLVLSAWDDGWLSRVLAIAPLRLVGRASYTIYLVHWPVFLVVDARRTDLDGPALFALRLAVTGAISTAIYHLFECPLRYRRWLRSARLALGVAALTTLALLGTALVMPAPDLEAIDLVAEADLTVVRHPVRVAIVGDGAEVVESILADDNRFTVVAIATTPNCPLVNADALRTSDAAAPLPLQCEAWSARWAEALATDADVVVVAQGRADLAEQRIDDAWTGLDHLDHLLKYTAALQDVVRAARVDDRLVILAPPSGSGSLAGVLHTEFERAARGGGVVVLQAPRADAVLEAYDDARRETGRGWPKPFGERVPEPLRVLVVGDSTSFWIASGLEKASETRNDIVVGWAGEVSCPMLRLEEYRGLTGSVVDTSHCPRFTNGWAEAARVFDPDAVLVVSSAIDAADFRLPGSSNEVGFGDAAFDQFWRDEAAAVVEELAPSGAVVLWADAPGVLLPAAGASERWNVRLARYNDLIAEFDAAYAQVRVVSLMAHLGAPGTEVDQTLRPDGVHLTQEAATDAAEQWLIEAVFDAWIGAARDATATGCFTSDGRRPKVEFARCGTG